MAKGIQDIGDNLGYLYKTLPDGVTILTTEKNTQDGARSMRINGLVNAPLAASRSAVGTITVSSAAGAGAITAINIAAVNQIGANINVVSSTASVVAAQIAAAINAFTPGSGDNYSAQSDGAVVYVFSSPSNGSAANGLTITVSVTDPSIVTVTTAFTNGSSDNGVYDSVMGYRYWIDADYGSEGTPGSGTATPTVLTYAQEITEYITNRGFQAGVGTLSLTIATDALSTVDRFCSITQIVTTNQGGAATDSLEYINPTKFIEGDIIFIRSTSASQVLTVKDAANATVTTSPNIYLTDENNFILQRNKVLMLRYTFDNSLGGIFVEMSRSVTGGIIPVTIAGISVLVGANSLSAGSTYYITDLGDNGVFTQAISSNQYSTTGQYIRRVPKGYASCWRADMTAPTIGLTYRYYQNVYTSVTGAVGTAPDADTTNWTVVSKTNNTSYESQINEVGLNTVGNLSVWPFIWEKDQKGNHVAQSYYSFTAILGVNSFNIFKWTDATINNVSGNVIVDSRFDCANSDGAVYDNFAVNGSKFYNNALRAGSVCAGNTLIAGGTVLDNFVDIMVSNFINGGGQAIANNGVAGAYFYQIANNTVNGGRIYNNTISASGTQSIEWCTLYLSGEIKNNSLAATSKIRYAKLFTNGAIQNSTLFAPLSASNIEDIEVSNGTFELTDTGGGQVVGSKFYNGTYTVALVGDSLTNATFNNSTINLTLDGALIGLTLNGCTMTFTANGSGGNIEGITTTGTPSFVFAGETINPLASSMIGNLDLDDAGVLSANVLTIASNLQLCGEFLCTGSGAKNITNIVNLPAFQLGCRFYNISGAASAVTFTKTAPGSWTGTEIMGAANFILEQNAAGPSDYLAITKFGGGVNTITAAVKLA